MADKYSVYKCGGARRPWLVIEDDGTLDGRAVASDLTEEDCERIVRLLNEDEVKGGT